MHPQVKRTVKLVTEQRVMYFTSSSIPNTREHH